MYSIFKKKPEIMCIAGEGQIAGIRILWRVKTKRPGYMPLSYSDICTIIWAVAVLVLSSFLAIRRERKMP
jgi:hypothetical protein